ncbi:MAG: GIY-YIG nuclease family protein [Saprospiraceae bacterium]|nr:GIY-YIG nuclease family protein [Saprospiraceae bacterium]
MNKLLPEPGCYVFIKKYGDKITPLYIGQALNLRSRIKSQLENVKIARRIEKSEKGIKLVMYCKVELKKGQQIKKVLNILEKI